MGDVPTGMISINGMCYNSETDSDQTTFAVIGDITIGQCYNAIEGKSNSAFAPRTPPDSKSVCNTCDMHVRTHATKNIAKLLCSYCNCGIKASHNLYRIVACASRANSLCGNAGGCQPEHCPGNSAGLRCNQQVKACTVNGQTECEGKKVSG